MKQVTNEVLQEQLTGLDEKLDVIEHLITGNGNPASGIIVRLDRLEQLAVRNRWMIRLLIGAAITAAIGAWLAKII